MRPVAALLAAMSLPLMSAAADRSWTVVKSPHFEVYSQSGERDGRSAMLWFEQLRAFFAQTRGAELRDNLENHGPVRVIGFASPNEYGSFRLQPTADAYFIGREAGDYIVMPGFDPDEFRVAAHEYAHVVLHSLGLRLPPWLAEGVAEVFSTVRIGQQGCVLGGDLPARTLILRQKRWIALRELIQLPANSPIRGNREGADIFYAESWAFADMLVFSTAYAPRFSELLNAVTSATPDAGTVERVYGKPVSAMAADLRDWIQTRRAGVALPGVPAVNQPVTISELTSFESGLMIADLLFASGELDRARAAYSALTTEQPNNAVVAAALGAIALRKGDRNEAREQWKRAMQLGVHDAMLCYEYAILAQDAGVPPDEIASALRHAIELKPDFDDARYQLGLLESNRGNSEASLEQLRAMKSVAPGRAYGYWTAMASALTATDRREEAKQAAAKAMSYASTPQERASAARLAYIAETDLTVQLTHDTNGNLQVVTARKPHGSNDWNPFIEPGDRIRSIEGEIREVECLSGKITGFRINTPAAAVAVTIPDPGRVLITGGAAEFVCGAADGRKVAIQYAVFGTQSADGVLRGMQFK